MNKDTNKQKWGNLLYIFLPVLLIFTMAYFMGEKSADITPKYSEIVQLTTIPTECEKIVNLLNDVLEGNVENTTLDTVNNMEETTGVLKSVVDMDKGYNLYTNPNFFTSTKPYKLVIYGNKPV